MSLNECKIIDLPKIQDYRGNLTFIEQNSHIPFDIQRIYYLFDVPGGAERGGHAHQKLEQLIIPVAGSFNVVIDDGKERKTIELNRAFRGLYICPMVWRELSNFSSGAVCLVIASRLYEEDDYIREYAEFKRATETNL